MTNRDPIQIQLAAEASIVGSVLLKRELLKDLGAVTPEHFVDSAHAAAWHKIVEDSTITDGLSLQLNNPALTDDHIARIVKSVHGQQTVVRARDYLIESKRKRELRRIAMEALSAIDDGTSTSEAIALQMNRAARTLDNAQTKSIPAHLVAGELHNKGNSPPIKTGISSLDYVLHGGIHIGSLTGIFARFKHGKTLMQATLAHNLEKRGIPTQMITLERRQGDIERFIVARCMDIDKQDLDFDNPAHNEFWEEYLSTQRSLSYLHRPGITSDELRSQILAEHYARGVKVVLIDYWQLIQMAGGRESREEKQSQIAQMLADLASDLDIAIVLTGQLNQDGHPRGGEGVLASAGIVVRILRTEDSLDVIFDTLVSNQGPERAAGSPDQPAARITLPGPHFAEPSD